MREGFPLRVPGGKELFEFDARIERLGKVYNLPGDGGKSGFE
jgi:hypothetical protein